MNFWKSYKSSIILLASMIIGGIVGAIWGEGASVLEPVADVFLHLLYCCVVPLIFCSLAAAIAKMEDMKKLRKILVAFPSAPSPPASSAPCSRPCPSSSSTPPRTRSST